MAQQTRMKTQSGTYCFKKHEQPTSPHLVGMHMNTLSRSYDCVTRTPFKKFTRERHLSQPPASRALRWPSLLELERPPLHSPGGLPFSWDARLLAQGDHRHHRLGRLPCAASVGDAVAAVCSVTQDVSPISSARWLCEKMRTPLRWRRGGCSILGHSRRLADPRRSSVRWDDMHASVLPVSLLWGFLSLISKAWLTSTPDLLHNGALKAITLKRLHEPFAAS